KRNRVRRGNFGNLALVGLKVHAPVEEARGDIWVKEKVDP
ncbi:unnamed protein product, partial [Arabidopsis halleri]